MEVEKSDLREILDNWDNLDDVKTMPRLRAFGVWKPVCQHGHPATYVELLCEGKARFRFLYCPTCKSFTSVTNVEH